MMAEQNQRYILGMYWKVGESVMCSGVMSKAFAN